jgi:gas vesicle protein
MRRAFSFFIGTLVGGIIGAAAALLLAPFSGEEMRGQIDSRFKNLATDIRQTASSKRIELQTRLETLRSPKP